MAADSPLLDQYSWAHLASGAFAQRAGLSLAQSALGAAVFELALEDPLKELWPDPWPDPTPDSNVNIVGDVLSVAAGHWLSTRSRLALPALAVVAAVAFRPDR